MAHYTEGHYTGYYRTGHQRKLDVTAADVKAAFAETGNRTAAAKLLKVQYKTLCYWTNTKYSFRIAMNEGIAQYKEKDAKK